MKLRKIRKKLSYYLTLIVSWDNTLENKDKTLAVSWKIKGRRNQYWRNEIQKRNSWEHKDIFVLLHHMIAQLVKNLPAMQETLVRFLAQEDPLEKG